MHWSGLLENEFLGLSDILQVFSVPNDRNGLTVDSQSSGKFRVEHFGNNCAALA